MTVTRDEATEALGEINRAGERMARLQVYKQSSLYFFIWGVVWLLGNTAVQFWPSPWTWPALGIAGLSASFVAGSMQSRQRRAHMEPGKTANEGWRFGLLSLVLFFHFFSLFYFLHPESALQGNAVISMFWAVAYMAAGIWFGWRLFAIGAVTAALIMVGYVWIAQYFFLWMGVVAGGALIAGGLWLRKA